MSMFGKGGGRRSGEGEREGIAENWRESRKIVVLANMVKVDFNHTFAKSAGKLLVTLQDVSTSAHYVKHLLCKPSQFCG